MIATARAYSNIAFIKYWGNTNHDLRLPSNPSLSMNLAGLFTESTVEWDVSLAKDVVFINGQEAEERAYKRVSAHLDHIRKRAGFGLSASVQSSNNFPMGVGIASSASSFAALTLAGVQAAGLELSERELTTIARLGSGSASRSIPSGFVQWYAGTDHASSYAETFAPPDSWNIVDVIAIASDEHKKVVSLQGHESAPTSDLQSARVVGAQQRLEICKKAILARDFATFADVVEHDSNLMHAVMMTSRPPLFYWKPATLTLMELVREWRGEGLRVCYTLDAGPNVHCICVREDAEVVRARLEAVSGVINTLHARPGEAAHII